MKFVDTHSHKLEGQSAGLILAIEGYPPVPGGCSYQDLLKPANEELYIVPYVTNEHIERLHDFNQPIVYIHPRREKVSNQNISRYLKNVAASLVVLDTFSKFLMDPKDYFDLAQSFPEKIFLLAHGGGYELIDYIQIVRYCKNCFIDFSATQSIFNFGRTTNAFERQMEGLVFHTLGEQRLQKKILFGSDNPEFSQKDSLNFYQKHGAVEILNKNFQLMLRKSRICS